MGLDTGPEGCLKLALRKACCCFEQDLGALLLPRPQKPPQAAWQTVGNDKSIREQFKELESFMQQFEIFSSRFMYLSALDYRERPYYSVKFCESSCFEGPFKGVSLYFNAFQVEQVPFRHLPGPLLGVQALGPVGPALDLGSQPYGPHRAFVLSFKRPFKWPRSMGFKGM